MRLRFRLAAVGYSRQLNRRFRFPPQGPKERADLPTRLCEEAMRRRQFRPKC